MAKAYRSIARIQKTHGRNGEVVAVPTHGLPLLLREGLEVCVVPPALKGPRSLRVQACSGNAGGQLVSFEGIRALGEAAGLVGKTLLASVDELPEDFALHDADALLGREVQEVRLGSLGVIGEVLRGPANDVWVVRGSYGEVLVPVANELVREFPQRGPIVMDLPRGLVSEGEA